MNKTSRFLAAGLMVVGGFASPAEAAFLIDVREQGADVVFSFSGSLNVASADPIGDSPFPEHRDFDGRAAHFHSTDGTGVRIFRLFYTVQEDFGGSGTGGVGSGSSFGIEAGAINQLYLPAGYISGTPISGAVTFENTTVASLGMNLGTYVWAWERDGFGARDSATFTIVPEPAVPALLGLGAVFLVARRKAASRPSGR